MNVKLKMLVRWLILLALGASYACRGPAGPTGPEGPFGPEGPPGTILVLQAQIDSVGEAQVLFPGRDASHAVLTCWMGADAGGGPWVVVAGTALPACWAEDGDAGLLVGIVGGVPEWWLQVTGAFPAQRTSP